MNKTTADGTEFVPGREYWAAAEGGFEESGYIFPVRIESITELHDFVDDARCLHPSRTDAEKAYLENVNRQFEFYKAELERVKRSGVDMRMRYIG